MKLHLTVFTTLILLAGGYMTTAQATEQAHQRQEARDIKY